MKNAKFLYLGTFLAPIAINDRVDRTVKDLTFIPELNPKELSKLNRR